MPHPFPLNLNPIARGCEPFPRCSGGRHGPFLQVLPFLGSCSGVRVNEQGIDMFLGISSGAGKGSLGSVEKCFPEWDRVNGTETFVAVLD